MTRKYVKQFPMFVCLIALALSNTALIEAQNINAASPDQKTSADKKTQFLRVTADRGGEPLAMQTAITRYRPEQGDLVVDLVGVVHIGEGRYYEQLNDQFEIYDVVLYELVAPEGTRVPRGGKKARSGQSPLDLVSWMQNQAKSSLGLQSQLEKIDYQKSNLKHADMSPDDMAKKMAERGDSALTIGLSTMAEIIRQQNLAAQSPERREMINEFASEGLFDLINNPIKLKRMMASQFADSGVMEMGLGRSLNQLLITDRNEAAMKVLQKEIAAGKKKIAIFYGAAHMPDFEQRLVEDFGLKKTKQVWVDAWDLTKAGTKNQRNGSTDLMFRLLNELSK